MVDPSKFYPYETIVLGKTFVIFVNDECFHYRITGAEWDYDADRYVPILKLTHIATFYAE